MSSKPTQSIESHQVYQGGSSKKLMKLLKIEDETSVLYLGDHLFGDILKLKKSCAWRTGLVINCLKDEIASIKKSLPLQKKIDELMSVKIPLEKELDALISKKIEFSDKYSQSDIDKAEDCLSNISKINHSLSELILQHESTFNKYWGPVFKVGAEESFLSFQVEAYAGIYMSDLEDFLSKNPRSYYRPNSVKKLPHEVF